MAEHAPSSVIPLGDQFWNIRGSFKIRGLLNIGTQASLVRLASGRFVLLDACDMDAATAEWVRTQAGGGDGVEAILNLHPFHTVFVPACHALFPQAKLYGTARHLELQPELPWQELRVEDAELHAAYADDFDFTVPRGVDFISPNPKLHFSSVLAYHRNSRTLHVDDTVNHIRVPLLLRFLGADMTRFHPTLAKVLERRAGAAADFRAWTEELIELVADAVNLSAAHTSCLIGAVNRGPSVAERVRDALGRVEKTLQAHELRYG